jgi:hypothetical protein
VQGLISSHRDPRKGNPPYDDDGTFLPYPSGEDEYRVAAANPGGKEHQRPLRASAKRGLSLTSSVTPQSREQLTRFRNDRQRRSRSASLIPTRSDSPAQIKRHR